MQCNISLLLDIHGDSGLPYYTHLNTLTNPIFIYFPRQAMMTFCYLVIITNTYRNRSRIFPENNVAISDSLTINIR